MTTRTSTGTALAILAAAVVLTGCSDDSGDHDMSSMSASASPTTAPAGPSGTAATGQRNEADIRFAQDMIPHHTQAVEMAELAQGRAANSAIRDLAARIQQAQGPEIDTMNSWLRAWGAAASTSTTSMPGMDHGSTSMPGMDHGLTPMPGMMTAEQMAQLQAATGAEFDRMWLTMMIEHHQGAIQMAQTELAQGANPDAKALAQRIIADQQAEIQQMQTLLTQG
ncbi:DUF305 domain-containing protein [Nocardia barduliensis]|uniref:DUF305 domain-containing protein n=1 Tax=Nocardia barduliensis TaxID=2736643 RepID=UPI001573DAD6|nr:DUF305 domain-containing protein [Nocardia barduliensis]